MSAPSLAHPAHEPITHEERWRAIKERTTRGLLLFNSGPGFAHLEGDLWAVRACQGGFYRVDLAEETCDCPDFEHFGREHDVNCKHMNCKHIVAVAIAHAHRRSGVKVRWITAAGDPFYARGKKKPHRFTDAECAEAILEEEARRGYPMTDRGREAFAQGFHAPEYRADLEFLRAFGYGLLEDEEGEE